jgi:hypothetical protein
MFNATGMILENWASSGFKLGLAKVFIAAAKY